MDVPNLNYSISEMDKKRLFLKKSIFCQIKVKKSEETPLVSSDFQILIQFAKTVLFITVCDFYGTELAAEIFITLHPDRSVVFGIANIAAAN